MYVETSTVRYLWHCVTTSNSVNQHL